jgi:hypothetical protein
MFESSNIIPFIFADLLLSNLQTEIIAEPVPLELKW